MRIKRRLLSLALILAVMICNVMPVMAARGDSSEPIKIGFDTKVTGQTNKSVYYEFELLSSGMVTVQATEVYEIELYEYGSGDRIANAYAEYKNGKYYLERSYHLKKGKYKCRLYFNYKSGNSYSLKLSFKSAGESVPEDLETDNNSKLDASPVKTNKTYKGQLAINDPADYYSFSIPSKSAYIFSISHTIDSLKAYIESENGTTYLDEFLEIKAPNTLTKSSSKVTLPKGNYYLVVENSKGYGNYSFSLSDTAAKYSIASATSKHLTYNGKAQTPTITVKGSDGKVLKKGTDYTIKLSPSTVKKAGVYTATITGTGSYSGTKKVNFNVNPAKPVISAVTPVADGFKLTLKKAAPGAGGYQLRYSTKSSFPSSATMKSNITKASTLTKTVKDMGSKMTYYVSVRSYVKVNGKTCYSDWSAYKKVTTK